MPALFRFPPENLSRVGHNLFLRLPDRQEGCSLNTNRPLSERNEREIMVRAIDPVSIEESDLQEGTV